MEKALGHTRNIKGTGEGRKQEWKADKDSVLKNRWGEETFDSLWL